MAKEKPHERMKKFDEEKRKEFGPVIVGVDESGRGSFAGPIAAGAVILPASVDLPGLNDSKVMTQAKREALYEAIKGIALGWSVALINSDEIDAKGLTWANREVMRRAVKGAEEMADLLGDLYIFDQSPKPALEPSLMMSKADATSLSVAAAAVMAKVTRDAILVQLGQQYPDYGFAESKGYVNAAHIAAVNKYGRIPGIHRFSYNVKGVNANECA